MNKNLWYSDSDCSRHMSIDKSWFKKFEFMNGDSVTFGDGSITTIKGKWNVEIPSLPIFHNILFVNGLKANLLSISQFCDKNHSVQFSKEECNIYNCPSKLIMISTRT
jgi:hypothetical protein